MGVAGGKGGVEMPLPKFCLHLFFPGLRKCTTKEKVTHTGKPLIFGIKVAQRQPTRWKIGNWQCLHQTRRPGFVSLNNRKPRGPTRRGAHKYFF